MDCTRFEEWLFEELEGELAAPRRAQLDEHLRGCARCRGLRAALRDGAEAAADLPAGMLAGVLEATSGPACGPVQRQLADELDDTGGARDELLAAHLAGCAGCSAVAHALARLQHDLPALAEVDPGEAFTASVLAATGGERVGRPHHPVAPARVPAWVGWRDRMVAHAARLTRRPRFALEGAYLGVLVLVLLFGLPSTSIAGLPVRALDGIRQEAGNVQRAVSARVDVAFDYGRAAWSDSADRLGEYLADRAEGVLEAPQIESASGWLAAAREMASGIWQQLVAPLLESLRGLWSDAPATTSSPTVNRERSS